MNARKAHATEIPGYEGRMQELVDFIVGKLRYDRVQEFHSMLASRYYLEAQVERLRERHRLADALLQASHREELVRDALVKVWTICEPFSE